MNRRLFTKVAGVSIVGVLAGCTSLDDEDQDDPAADDTGSEADDSETGEEADNDAEAGEDPESPDDENGTEDDDTEASENDSEEPDDADPEDDSADPEDDSADPEADETENGDDDPEADEETADTESEDEPAEPDELDAELALDDELEDRLEVDHEFVWESGEGSHLCNIIVEMENTTTDSELFYEGIGMLTDADGAHLSSDVARFSLGPENSAEHTFSLDQCAAATAYRVEFGADQIVED